LHQVGHAQALQFLEAMIEIFKSDLTELKLKARNASEEISWNFISRNWDSAFRKIVGN
jgi:uncharacterized protein YdhG (YjbR/CyaY superfamily)